MTLSAATRTILGEAQVLAKPAEPAAYLDGTCGANATLRLKVESLLQPPANAGNFLQPTVLLEAPGADCERLGPKSGRFKLLEKVREGLGGLDSRAGGTGATGARTSARLIAALLVAASLILPHARAQQGDADTKQLTILRAKAKMGDAQSQFELGYAFYAGKFGVATNYVEALKWFQQAADQNHAAAQYQLGLCHAYGEGVAKNEPAAVKWFRKAAEQNDAKAQYSLGVCYAHGQGVGKDEAEAVKWYRKAGEQNHAQAQFNLGTCYADGQGVATNSEEAVKWLRRAAEQNYAKAQHSLGACYAQGEGVVKDEAAAVKWFRKAAEQNYSLSQHNLGNCFCKGQGVAKDVVEGYKWFLLAAAQGDARAKHNASMLQLMISREQIAEGKRRADVWLEERKATPLRTR